MALFNLIQIVSFILLFFLFFTNCQDVITKYDLIEEAYDCDTNCWFREDEVTSETISKWPVNCTDICGIVSFTKNSDLTVFELQEYFKNFKVLKGSLTISDTEYGSIEFLSSLEQVHCEVLDKFEIGFNRNLELLNFGNFTNITCDFYAMNNTILDASSFCEKYGHLTSMSVFNNYKNCKGCFVNFLYGFKLEEYRGCTLLTNNVWFYSFWPNHDPPTEMSPLYDVQNISGSLEFVNTDLFNFSFFQKLENFKSKNNYQKYDLNIEQCWNLTRFGMPVLKTLTTTARDNFLMNVERVHDDFCFTTTEMHFFLQNNVQFNKLEAKYCVNVTLDSICIFDRMSDLDANCTEILGNVIVGTGDEVYKDKLTSVQTIYGSLTIQGTIFTDLGFLGNLEYVAILGNVSTIPLQVTANKNLQNPTLASLKRVLSKTVRYQVSFQDNGRSFLNSSACLDFMDKLFDTNVVFDGKECEVIDRTDGQNGGGDVAVDFLIFLVIAVNFIYDLF